MKGERLRGQAWSFDFMASAIIFFIVLVTLLFVWEYAAYQNADQVILSEMQNKALLTADMIIRTEGFPKDWNESNVQLLGLAEEENLLNQTKILSFVSMDYDSTKTILNVQGLEYYFEIVELNGTMSQINGTDLVIGIDPTVGQDANMIVPITRYVLFDSRVARLNFYLWY